MGDEIPTLQQADTDGTGPVRRRRPALSCVECRRRKVKCDRRKPCGPCTRTKSPTCTYRPNPRASERCAGSPIRTISSNVSTNDNARSPGQTSLGSGALRQEEKDATIQQLVERVRQLEHTLSTSSQSSRSIAGTQAETHFVEPSLGHFVKSKFYGGSHWNNVLEPYDALGNSNITINTSNNRVEINTKSELYTTVAECKRMARKIKASRIMQPSILREVQAFIPPRHVCDKLVACYLQTFEEVFRVLHIPSFMKEYEEFWLDSAAASPSILLVILLVCAIGVVFYTGTEQARLRADCSKWLQAAESWLSAPHAKSRFNMAGTQISVLILLARQVCSVDGDLVWVPGGRLLRGAMHLGLHRDPSGIGKMSVFHAEMRRRLWATILEFTVQSSLDMGMPPMISPDDYDTLPPSNINDEDLTMADTVPLQPKPLTEYTQCSIQIAFYETLPLRLEICRLINSLRLSLSYDETLKLGAEMLTVCQEKTSLLQSFLNSSAQRAPNAFQIKLFDTLMRRFFLCLHRPFYNRAAHDPKFYYSRKVCLDTSLIIVTPTIAITEDAEDDWVRLTYRGVGFVKSFFLHSLSTIYFELTSRLENERENLLSAPLITFRTSSQPVLPPELQPCYKLLVYARRVAEMRLRRGEVNAKGFAWLCAAVARVDALLSHTDPDAAVLAAAKKAVSDTANIMRQAYFDEHGEHVDLSRPGASAGRDYGRGEGPDDVTGMPRSTGQDASGAGMTGTWPDGEDMDWERLMRDEGLDMGWGLGGSPESWFGWGWDMSV